VIDKSELASRFARTASSFSKRNRQEVVFDAKVPGSSQLRILLDNQISLLDIGYAHSVRVRISSCVSTSPSRGTSQSLVAMFFLVVASETECFWHAFDMSAVLRARPWR
jgi:hypothetical protein